MTMLLISGAPERKKLDRIRADIDTVEREIEDLAGATFPTDEGLARLRRQIAEEARHADVQLAYFVRPGDAPQLPAITHGYLAAVFPDYAVHIQSRLEQLNPAPGLPRPAREKAVAAQREKLAALEVAEELEILRLESEGFGIDRRATDVAAMLAIWDRP